MATYLYCLLPGASGPAAGPAPTARDNAAPTPVTGIGGAPVRELQAAGMVAWVSDLELPVPDGKSLRAEHAGVVAAALASGETPLPARVGQAFPDDGALCSELESRSRSLTDTLARLRGKVEMMLIVQLPPEKRPSREGEPGAGATSSGRAYLERLRAEFGELESVKEVAERLRVGVRASLSGLAAEEAVAPVRGTRRFLVSHLVEREMANEWRSRARALSIEGALRTFVAGPLPPYSFASTAGASIFSSGAPER